jgi:hypothetical protein
MPSAQAENQPVSGLPPLAPLTRLSRPLSTPEYYHASIATSPNTLEKPRYQGFFIIGHGNLSAERWQWALDQAAAVHPGTRLRLIGKRRHARWDSDGAPPRLRIIEHCSWDMRSSQGLDELDATPLPLDTGPTIELVVASVRDGSTLLFLRSHHAVMDGIGSMVFLEDLFRALRGEPLVGSNAAYSDVELMLSTGVKKSTSRHIKTCWLTGTPAGDAIGDEWRRVSLGAPSKNLLPRVATLMAEFAHQSSELPALIAVPVNLRRHVPGLVATTNFSNMLFVPMYVGDGPAQFSERMKAMLAERMEAFYPPILDVFKRLPMNWIDRLLSRTPKNYRTKKALETAVISNLGRWDSAIISCEGFQAERMFLRPLAGSVFSTLVCVGDHVEFAINLPRVLASNGRSDAFVDYLLKRLPELS